MGRLALALPPRPLASDEQAVLDQARAHGTDVLVARGASGLDRLASQGPAEGQRWLLLDPQPQGARVAGRAAGSEPAARAGVDLVAIEGVGERGLEASLELLEEARETHQARWTGLVVDRSTTLLDVSERGGVDAVFAPFSAIRCDLLDGLLAAREAGLAAVAIEPLARGLLAGRPARSDASPWPPEALESIEPAAERARRLFVEHGVRDPVVGSLRFVLAHEIDVCVATLGSGLEADHLARLAKRERLPGALFQQLYALSERTWA